MIATSFKLFYSEYNNMTINDNNQYYRLSSAASAAKAPGSKEMTSVGSAIMDGVYMILA
jgi:hypothetical protein